VWRISVFRPEQAQGHQDFRLLTALLMQTFYWAEKSHCMTRELRPRDNKTLLKLLGLTPQPDVKTNVFFPFDSS
jgi:hypothetical protein